MLTKDSYITRHTYETIKFLKNKFPKTESFILTSDNLELVVADKDEIYIWKPSGDIKNIELAKLNWTSAIFASLAYGLINHQNKNFSEILAKAIGDAHKNSGVKDPLAIEKNQPEKEELNIEEKDKLNKGKQDWTTLSGNWEKALNKKGIIHFMTSSNEEKNELHIWRASTDLPEYITCVEGKREAIKRIWDKINNFKMNVEVNRSCGILLEADPGVGKTFLARRLAEELGFTCIQHDITQMVNREELLDLFDMVATAQTEKNNKGLVVFVDEINATLEGSPVYGAFLSPLEAGYYMRRGIKFNLKPCIWIFAGTRNENKENKEQEKEKEKLEDFTSRLSLIEEIDYKALQIKCFEIEQQTGANKEENDKSLETINKLIQDSMIKETPISTTEIMNGIRNKFICTDQIVSRLIELDRQARLEQVYLGAKMINQIFCDVREIEEKVLDIFYRLDPTKAPARRIGRLAEALQNVQYGKVDLENCTGTDWAIAKKETKVKKGEPLKYILLNFG